MKISNNKAFAAKYKLSKFYVVGVVIFIIIFSGLALISAFLSFLKL